MGLALAQDNDPASVLAEAFVNAGKFLGLTQTELGEIIGKDRTVVSRARIDPHSKAGELALLFIRCYRALFVLMGGNEAQMRYWIGHENIHTGGIPLQQMKSISGLVQVLHYLDAMRGKV